MSAEPSCHRYPMAPLIRFTLLGLYLALVLPLPLLAPEPLRLPLLLACIAGLALVLAITSERVELDGQELRVGHPPWCSWLLRRGWRLSWNRITALTPVTTSQGGRVYYVRSVAAEDGRSSESWLLPQRVAHFDDFLERFSSTTGLSTKGISRISPPWTYQLLAVLSALLLAGEILALLPGVG
ncbi:hypothetical protein [Synechococcus sp. CS-1332]|uniref:hypothetical protein n=1 Tax=Synechococcus sp. CS-1332 TaxID=2847972 RepID=UPI00223B781C|nr:hypothetical protein [Synechococcus sp. CS-1332]MCT0206867.1 hypothetical protein [Synechococcus sp. CS-1332]